MTLLPDKTDIQGNILRPYRFPVAHHLFLRVEDAGKALAFVARAAAHVTSGADWVGAKPPSAVNVGFTWRGLVSLGLPTRLLESFPVEFRQGMAARAELLGDTGGSSPSCWDRGLGTGDAHLLVSVHARSVRALQAAVDSMVEAAPGLVVTHSQPAERLPGNREHFGFQDGIAQPAILGVPGQRAGGGLPAAATDRLGLPPGEFVHGYPGADGKLPAGPPPPFDRNGTFLVYRKLEQDVPAFRRFLADQGRCFPGGSRMLAAKLMGRWPDGTPLELSPEREDAAIAFDPARRNAFRYVTDPRGLRCPLGSHIRRANPRDGLPFHGALVNRHRLIRRGMPYGRPLAEGLTDPDGEERGVLFYAFNASFARQFEFIQSQWLNDGNALGLGADTRPGGGSEPAHRRGRAGEDDRSRLAAPVRVAPAVVRDHPRRGVCVDARTGRPAIAGGGRRPTGRPVKTGGAFSRVRA